MASNPETTKKVYEGVELLLEAAPVEPQRHRRDA